MQIDTPYALYIHIPFCRVRCTYCAFNTYTDLDDLLDDYVQALIQEISHFSGLEAHTVYFGGGTPSLLTTQHITQILQAVHDHFAISTSLEVTLEANPGTIDYPKLAALREAGITRLSIGMQSAHASELQLFGRLHDFSATQQAVADARRAGFDNLNLDLIYGAPHQTRTAWRESLRKALALSPDHVSLYALSLESGTPMTRQVKYGELTAPDSDLVADMYEDATDILEDAGFIQYEISNWALPDQACRHNLQYWRNLPYLGLGAGAHGYAAMTRTVNAMRPELYIERLQNSTQHAFPQTPATIKAEAIERETDMGETLFMGLRLLDEGLSLHAFEARYEERVQDRFAQEINTLIAKGLLTQDGDYLKLTRAARLISNYVFQHFLVEQES